MNTKSNVVATEVDANHRDELKGYDPKWTISWNVKVNPKRKSSQAYARFEGYMGAKTVREYLERGGTRGDLKYDENVKQFITINRK